MFPPLLQRLVTVVAFAALAGMLAFGGAVRYSCYCSGSVVLTTHEHCHGEHGEEGPALHAPPGHRHDSHASGDSHDHGHHGEGDDHDGHEHDLVKTSTDLRLPEAVSIPEGKLVALPWSSSGGLPGAAFPLPVPGRLRPLIAEDPPPYSHRVARAVVRLI